MSKIGEIERATQNEVIAWFKKLGWEYLGNWEERLGNANIEKELLERFLSRDYTDEQIERAKSKLYQVAKNQVRSLYDINLEFYELLRYGVKVKTDASALTQTVWLIDWDAPEHNHFAVAEEVTVVGPTNTKRPDIVLYVNGIALGVLELKSSSVSVSKGIRQNIGNQREEFIRQFFTTVQLVMAGNNTEGLRYGVVDSTEKFFLHWKEPGEEENLLHRQLAQICRKDRFLELIHDFIIFDKGKKKIARHNQYFAVRAAQTHVDKRQGGIIWHSQGSGKSLIMVWLAKWIREHIADARVLIITDRIELDEQIERVFTGVREKIYRTKSGADLVGKLNQAIPPLMCSLIHKFGRKEQADYDSFIDEIRQSLPTGFHVMGSFFVFVDECHRTESGKLHRAMKAILPDAMFIGFSGTPLLKKDKPKSIEVFGPYIHTYKFNEAVEDKAILDIRYEARDIDQEITSHARIDEWFEAKTRGLTDHAKNELKKRWGTMQKVLSSRSRLEKIVADILLDMANKPRLSDGQGNALLVSGSIYEACKLYKLFTDAGFDKCAIVTSYTPNAGDLRCEDSGEGNTQIIEQYDIYQSMLKGCDPEEFEKETKRKFINEPEQMKLLIVVDKLLTGFDAPPATYLYIDKKMQDHGLFQAICRVNRLDGDDKDYGYIVDYKDLFQSLEKAVTDYTSGAFENFDASDVEGLLKNRLASAREKLDEALEAIKALCEPVPAPREETQFIQYFCGEDRDNKEHLEKTAPQRMALYRMAATLIRAYANIANELVDANYTPAEIQRIKKDVRFFEKLYETIKIASGDYIDLKRYEPAMRHLIDTYIRADDSEKVSDLDDFSLVELIVERGEEAIESLPESIKGSEEATAETIENNVRRRIIEENPTNPKYYEAMSQLLAEIIKMRREKAIEYREYLKRIVELTQKIANPGKGNKYPEKIDTAARRALFDNLGEDEVLAIRIDDAIRSKKQDGWRGDRIKERQILETLYAITNNEQQCHDILELARNQAEY